MGIRPSVEGWTAEWWLFATGLVLLVPVDMLTTTIAISKYGMGVEANPLVRWLFAQGFGYVVGVNLVVALLVVVLFSQLVDVVEKTRPPYDNYLHYGVVVWLSLGSIGGAVLFANNISVILFESSILLWT